jgi:hypothetical protein
MRGIKSKRGICGSLSPFFALLFASAQLTLAADVSWIRNNGTFDFNTGANWSGGIVPGNGDTALITNSITAVTSITDRTVQVTIGNLTMSNSTAFTHRLVLSNATFNVAATTLLGSNAAVALGTGLGLSGSTFSNGNLYLARNAAIQFNSSNNASALIVAGTFTNSAGNVMTNSGGALARALFTASQPTTNSGTMTFLGTTAGALLNTGLVVQVGVAGTLDTFYNAGTVRVGNASSLSSGVSIFSNQFVNAGVFVLTNNIASGSSSNFVFVSGASSGAAITNALTGTMKLVIAGGTIPRNELRSAADIVNLGTISADTVSGTSARTNVMLVAAGSTFSNAPGGQALVFGSPAGVLRIQADSAVNAGTNLVNAGTLIYASSSGGAGTFANSGAINIGMSGGAAAILNVVGDWQNSGAINLRNIGTLTGGVVTNLSGGIISAVAGGNVNSAMFNASGGSIFLTTNVALRMSGDLANEGLISLGPSGGATLSNNNLYLVGGGALLFSSSGGSLTPASVIVAGTFTNSHGSTMTNSGGGFARLAFTANRPVTNSGTMAFLEITAGSALNNALVLQVGRGGALTNLNTYYNAGAFMAGNAGMDTTRTYVFSNQFVNTGSFTITNNNTTGTNFFFVTGMGSGAAITNQATGTIQLVIGAGTGLRNRLTNAADVVNLGTISGQTSDAQTNAIVLALSRTFSNAPGGQVIASGSSDGALQIQADRSVNAGANVITAGSLRYLTSNGGNGILENAGTIALAGGNLSVNTLTNKVTGAIRSGGTVSGSTLVNFGAISVANGQTFTFTGSVFTNTSSGIVIADGGILDLRGGFFNSSTASNEFNLGSGTLLFQSSSGTFTLAGRDLGPNVAGMSNNFFISNLQLVGHTLTLRQSTTNNALYVGGLFGDASSILNVNGQTVYYTFYTNDFQGTINLQGGQFIKIGNGFVFLPTSGINNWDTAANWNANAVPADTAAEARIIRTAASSMTVIQDTAASPFTIKDLVVQNSGGGVYTLILGRDQTWSNGGTIGAGGQVNVTNGVTLAVGAPLRISGGTLNLLNGRLSGDILSSSTIALFNAGTLAGGTVTNLSGGKISAVAGGNVDSAVFNANNGTINVTNNVLQMRGDFANAGLVIISNPVSTATLSNNNLYMVGGGAVRFAGGGSLATNTLIVAGMFTNTTTSAMTNDGGGPARLLFTANQPVTNSGTMAFTQGGAIRVTVQVGKAGALNTFYNAGTFISGDLLVPSGTVSAFVFSNQFVNAGTLVITNASTTFGASAGSFFTVTGTGSGAAITNQATGTIKLVVVSHDSSTLPLNVLSSTGDVVNLGTISLNTVNTANTMTNTIVLAATRTFSNAAGGQVIVSGPPGVGASQIQADRSVNLGTNLLNSSRLIYQTSSGGAGILENGGTILFSGGVVSVATLTNTSAGVISGVFTNPGGNTLTIVNLSAGGITNRIVNAGTLIPGATGDIIPGIINLAGATIQATNGTMAVAGGILNSGNLTLRSVGTLTGGAVTNLSGGVMNAVAGGNIDSALVNASGGTINATNGLLRSAIELANAGVLNIGTFTGAATFTTLAAWQNTGRINLRSTGTLTGSMVTNLSGGVITAVAGGNIGSAVFNANGGTLQTTNGSLRVIADLSNDGLINVGTETSVVGNTLIANNLYMGRNGSIQFIAPNFVGIGSPTNRLVVGGVFTNTASTVVFNHGVVGIFQLLFTNTSNIVTNQGTMQFFVAEGAPGSIAFVLQVGSAATPNTFYNQGTYTLGGANTFNAHVFSNQLVNAGVFVVSNASASLNASLPFSVTGIPGTALTNEATGSMRLVATGISGGVRNVMSLNRGGYVNLGTLSFEHIAASKSNQLVLAESGSVFSNAVGGRVLALGGQVFIQAGRAVNLGSNVVSSGTLTYLSSSGNTGVLENAGVVEVSGGNLVADGSVTNASGSAIRTTSGSGTIVSSVANLMGGTILATNGANLKLKAGFASTLNSGTIDVRSASTISNGVPTSLPIDNRGTIRLEGTLIASSVTNSGTITGTGALAANLVVTNGIVIPGLSIGTLTVNSNVVFKGGTLAIELGTNPGANDQLAINGSLTILTNSMVCISGGATGNVYTAVTFTPGQLSGTFSNCNPSSYTITYDNTNGIITVEFNGTPPNLNVSPATGFNASGEPGGPFAPASQMYSLTNTGNSALSWSASVSSNWLDLSVTNGVLDAAGNTNVTVSINTNANTLVAGTYTNSISFINLTNHQGDTNRVATLTVLTSFQAWQMQYFGCTDCPQAAPTADPDGDGCDNLCEFMAGFNPTNNAAYLHVISIEKIGDEIKATYLGANGDNTWSPGIISRTNVLEFSTGDGGSYSNNFETTGQTNVLSGGNGLGVVTNMIESVGATNPPARYYRIRLVP